MGTNDAGVIIDERPTVVGVDSPGNTASAQRLLEKGVKGAGVSAPVITGTSDETGMIVKHHAQLGGFGLALAG